MSMFSCLTIIITKNIRKVNSMEFAITFKGDMSPKRTLNLCKQAEDAGFTHTWFFDSHVLWRECYPVMAMCMEHTKNMRFGPCVTNPGVRELSVAGSLFASLALQSGNRFLIGLGRGDSSRRVIQKSPMTVTSMMDFTKKIKQIVRGDKVLHEQTEIQLPWAEGYNIPIWIAAYGPKALKAAGEVGDGLIIQLADPGLVKWFADQSKSAGKAAGRDMSDFKLMSAAPVWIGDIKKSREQTQWFPAMVGNHVADIVEKYGSNSQDIPEQFTKYIEGRKGYDYSEHGDKDAGHLEFIKKNPEIIDAFSILGSAKDHVKKLKDLESVGVDQFNIYLMCGDEERIVSEYAKNVIPHFKN